MEKLKAEADAVADRVLELSEHKLVDVGDGRQVLVVPSGKTVKSVKPMLDEYLTVPERRKGVSTHKTLLSLIEHTNRFKSHLYREDLYFQEAFGEACEEARLGTALPLFFGSPE